MIRTMTNIKMTIITIITITVTIIITIIIRIFINNVDDSMTHHDSL